MTDNAQLKEYYSMLKKRTELILNECETGNNQSEAINKINQYFFEQSRPKSFGGPKGQEVRQIKSFEETCILMQQHITIDPKSLTVLEFYQSLETIKKQLKRQQKNSKKR